MKFHYPQQEDVKKTQSLMTVPCSHQGTLGYLCRPLGLCGDKTLGCPELGMINTSCQSTSTNGENVSDPKASSGCPACRGLSGGKWWQSGNLLCCPGALTASYWEQMHRWSPSSQCIGYRYCLPTPTLLYFKSEMARGYLRAPLRMPGARTEVPLASL